MGLFRKKNSETLEQSVNSYFRLIGGYTPSFTTFEGGIYEMELTRAAIHCIATHVSKLMPSVHGANASQLIAQRLKYQPNPIHNSQQYLYRIGTLLSADNNVIIAPLYDDFFQHITGFYPLKASKCEIVDYNGEQYVRYRFENGAVGAVPLKECGIMIQMQYESEYFGSNNGALSPTIRLMNARNQSITEGVKSSAKPQFLAKLAGVFKEKDIDNARREFRTNNLSSDNTGGAIIVDAKYESVQPISTTPYIVDEKQAADIKDSVYTYFGVNESIMQNKFDANQWSAFYEGKIEPIAIQLSLVHTNVLFSENAIARGNKVDFYANRMAYMSTADKLNTVTQLFDRGFLTHNQGLKMFDMPPVEGGDEYYIRKEYANVDDLHFVNGFSDEAIIGNEDTEKLEQEIANEVSKPLNGEQSKALVTILLQYINGKLTLAQTVNIFSLIAGIPRDEAEEIIEAKSDGATEEVDENADEV